MRIRFTRLIALILYFVCTPNSWAADLIPLRCESPESLDGRLTFCSDNVEAAKSAEKCLNEQSKAIRDAGPALAKLYSVDFAGKSGVAMGRQKNTFNTSETDYQRAVDKLNALIREATDNLHKMAAYFPVMLDDENESVPCYLDNAARVEAAVDELDQKVSELKGAKKANEKLRGIVAVSNEGIENNFGSPGGKGDIGTKKFPIRDSKVSGEISNDSLTVGLKGPAGKGKPARESGSPVDKASGVSKGINTPPMEYRNEARGDSTAPGSRAAGGRSAAPIFAPPKLSDVERTSYQKSLSSVKARFQKNELDSALQTFLRGTEDFNALPASPDAKSGPITENTSGSSHSSRGERDSPGLSQPEQKKADFSLQSGIAVATEAGEISLFEIVHRRMRAREAELR
jgi:hypothetical protein